MTSFFRLFVKISLVALVSTPVLSSAVDMWGMNVQDGYEFCGVRKKFSLSYYIMTSYNNGAEFHMNVYRKINKKRIKSAIKDGLSNCNNCSEQDKKDLIGILPAVEFKDRVIFTKDKVSLLKNGNLTELGGTTSQVFEALRDYIQDETKGNPCP